MKEINEKAIEYHARGNTYFAEEKYNEAINEYLKAIEIEPEYAIAYFHLAEAYEKKKLDDKALSCYCKAIEYNPAIAENQIASGLDSLLSGPFNEAIKEYKNKKLGQPPKKQEPHPQKDETPSKILINPPSDPHSVVGTISPVTVKILSSSNRPLKDIKVHFSIPPFNKGSDNFILKTLSSSSEGKDNLTINTNQDGCATVYFKRKNVVGKNFLFISLEGKTNPLRFVDTTVASTPKSIFPLFNKEKEFPAGEEETFSFKLVDKYGNPVCDHEVCGKLTKVEGGKLKLMNSQKLRTDTNGIVNFKFSFLPKANEEYRIEIDSPIHFVYSSKTVAKGVKKLVFLTSSQKVKAGQTITLQVKVLDNMDNPVKKEFIDFKIIDFKGKKGTFPQGSTAFSDENGIVSVSYMPSQNDGDFAIISPSSKELPASNDNTITIETINEQKSPNNKTVEKINSKTEKSVLENLIPIDINDKFAYTQESNVNYKAQTHKSNLLTKEEKIEGKFQSFKNKTEIKNIKETVAKTIPKVIEKIDVSNKESKIKSSEILPANLKNDLKKEIVTSPSTLPMFKIQVEKKEEKKNSFQLEKALKFFSIILFLIFLSLSGLVGYEKFIYHSWLNKGNKLFIQNEYKAALSYFLKCNQKKPTDINVYKKIIDTYLQIAKIEIKKKNYSQAKEYIQTAESLSYKLIKLHPSYINLLFSIGDSYAELEEYEKAISLYSEIKKKNKTDKIADSKIKSIKLRMEK